MRNFLVKILLLSAIIGALVGLASDLFIRFLQTTTKFVWNDIVPNAQQKPLFIICATLVGGLLMGVCVKYFGVNQGIGFESVADSVVKDGELGMKQIKRVVANSTIGLITGASIGPESPLITVGGFMGDRLARILKVSKQQTMAFITIALGGSLGMLFDAPIVGPVFFAEKPPTKDKNTNNLLIFASMMAASIGYAIYVWLKAPFLSNLQLIPAYGAFRSVDLFYGLLVGIAGTIIGLSLKTLITKLKAVFSRWDKQPVLRGALVGLFIGICGALYPLVLFDGSAQLGTLVAHATMYSTGTMLMLALVRFVSTAAALSGGYQGGNIFPTIFICGAFGLALHALCPFIPASVAMVATMVPAMYVFLPLPLVCVFLFTELSSFNLIPVMVMGLIAAYFIMNYKTVVLKKQ